VALLLIVTISDVLADNIVIDEISIPEALEKLGYTEQIASLRLWDAIQRINEETADRTDLDRKTPLLTESQKLEITEPETGLSLRSVTQVVRKVLGIDERRIAGEFVCGDAACTPGKAQLLLRVFQDGQVHRVSGGPIGDWSEHRLDDYFYEVAMQVLEVVDPIVTAENLNGIDNDRAMRIAEAIVDSRGAERARAATLLVQINASQGNHVAAESWSRRVDEISWVGSEHWRGIALLNRAVAMRYSLVTVNNGVSVEDLLHAAVRHFERADNVDLAYRNYLTIFYWGVALEELGQFPEAAEKFAVINEMRPDDHEALIHLGYTLYRSDKPDLGAARFAQAASKRESDNAYDWWGIALMETGDYEQALEKFDRAVELNPRNGYALHRMGIALQIRGEHEEAIRKFWRATRRNPDNRFAYLDWGISLAALGRHEEAVRRYATAVSLDPNFQLALDGWAASVEALKLAIIGTEGSATAGAAECEKLKRLFDPLRVASDAGGRPDILAELDAEGTGC
jgi:tetratricopeptide (TPR) repeat protein